MTFTVFRVTGGASPHPQENEYRITPYTMERETLRYYYEPGKKLHNKRTTANSEWFTNVDKALDAAIHKVNEAITKVHTSLNAVLNVAPPTYSFTKTVFVCVFRYEIFTLYQYKVVDYKNRGVKLGWRVENDKTRIKQIKRDAGFVTKEDTSGRCYVYQHHSQSHNYERPHERWVGINWETIKLLVEQYGNDRIRHLERCKQRLREWVRLFNKEVGEK